MEHGIAATLIEALSLPFALEGWVAWVGEVAGLLVLAIACRVAYWIASRGVGRLIRGVVQRSDNQIDDLLVKRRVFQRLAHVAPALLIFLAAHLFQPALTVMLQRAALIYMILAGIGVINALLDVFTDFASMSKSLRGKPIRGYVQTVKLFLFLVATILVLAAIMDKSPWKLLSGIGAVSAVLLLVFKDSILGLVASVQLSAYDMIQKGDWIEMPKYGADGDVLEVSLHTVKVQNWDKTITTIPTHALVADSFKNWRGMSESGGRRIKRALYIDTNTVHFCTDEMLDRFEQFDHLGEYLRERRAEVEAYNREQGVDTTHLLNGRQLTNLGCFRAYVLGYLKDHPALRKDLTLLVRQLAPTEKGIPLELYVFSADTRWVEYEAIQGDVFDHLLAAIREFGLDVFQAPAGRDLQGLGGRA